MSKDIPYYFADTGINGEVLGEQNIYSLPLTNAVLTSNVLILPINKTPSSASSRYFLTYDNPELGPYTDNNSINRNEIFNLNVNDYTFNVGVVPSTPLIIHASPTSSIQKQYLLAYDNPELGPYTDNNSINRNKIIDLNNQKQYRYLVQDSTGSSYATGSGNYFSFPTSSLNVTSSLVFYLNAYISASYGGTGSSWYDLSSTYTSASIVNGSTFVNLSGSLTSSINTGSVKAVVLNGTNQYVQAPSGFADFTNGLTCICLCNFGSAGNNERIMDFGNGSANENIVIYRYSTTNQLSFVIYQGTTSALSIQSNSIIDNNIYSVYTVRLSGSVCEFYKNGILDVTSSTTVRPNNVTRTSNFIGRSNWADAYWDNGFSVFALWNKGLSNTELADAHRQIISYNRNFYRYDGYNYWNSNILNLRFLSGSITGSNLTLPSGSSVESANFIGSQDIIINNVDSTQNNYLINKIGSGSNLIRRNDGITNKTIYTGDGYFSDATILTKGARERTTIESSDVTFYSLSDPSKNYSYKGSGSNVIRRNDGITDKTIYTGDGYLSSATINTLGKIDRVILQGSNVVINTNTNNFVPTVNKTYTFEVDYNYMFNQEIDSQYTIVTAYSLPSGFSLSSDAKRVVGYVNFTSAQTIKLELSDGSFVNIVLKPILYKKKYIY